jgi:membrane-associated phospholipid phosphatase
MILLCNDGDQSGRPGMPSSHSAEAAFFSAYYFELTDNMYIKVLLIIYALSIMISRYLKKCHNFNQIAVGAILGVSLSWLTVRHL